MTASSAVPSTMKAFQLFGERDIRKTELSRPAPGAGEVLIRIRRAGICGSDVHYYTHGRAGAFVPKRPLVLGHEFAGEVVALGEGADLKLQGARVTVDPSMPCGRCEYCIRGRYNLCSNMRFFGSASCDPHIDGGFAEFTVAPARNCHVLDDAIGWSEAAMIEPLSVAVHAANRAGSVAGKSALVFGGGAIGQLTALVLRAFGAQTVVLSDIAEFPRTKAVEAGADASIDALDEAFESRALDLSEGGFDLAFEAAGSGAALKQALGVVRRGGSIVQVGTLPAEVTVPLNVLMARELSLLGSFRFAHAFEIALGMVQSRRVKVNSLITGVLPLDEFQAAMDRAVDKRDAIKIQVAP